MTATHVVAKSFRDVKAPGGPEGGNVAMLFALAVIPMTGGVPLRPVLSRGLPNA